MEERIKRKKALLPREIYVALNKLKQEDRAVLYDAFFGAIFDGRERPENLTDIQAFAFSAYMPTIRKMTSQYENGKKGGRKNEFDTPSFLLQSDCNPTETQLKPKINPKSKERTKENIPYNKYKSINKYNTLYKQTTVCAHARETNKKNDDATELVSQIQNLATSDPATVSRFLTLVEELQKESERKINGKIVPATEIYAAYSALLQKDGAIELLRYIFQQIDATPGIRNPFGYTVSLLYNIATGQTKKNSGVENLQQREYTPEFLNSLFDNPDEL